MSRTRSITGPRPRWSFAIVIALALSLVIGVMPTVDASETSDGSPQFWDYPELLDGLSVDRDAFLHELTRVRAAIESRDRPLGDLRLKQGELLRELDRVIASVASGPPTVTYSAQGCDSWLNPTNLLCKGQQVLDGLRGIANEFLNNLTIVAFLAAYGALELGSALVDWMLDHPWTTLALILAAAACVIGGPAACLALASLIAAVIGQEQGEAATIIAAGQSDAVAATFGTYNAVYYGSGEATWYGAGVALQIVGEASGGDPVRDIQRALWPTYCVVPNYPCPPPSSPQP